MAKQFDEAVTAIGNVFLAKRSSYAAFADAYETFSRDALIEDDFFNEWYELLDREKDSAVVDHGWQKVCYNNYQRMRIIFRDDYTEDGKLAKLPDALINILRENMLLESKKTEEKVLVLKQFVDVAVTYADGHNKIVYPAEMYKIVKNLCEDPVLKAYYGDDAARTILERTITAVCDIQKYGSDQYIAPLEFISEVMVADGASKVTSNFCREILRIDDPKLSGVLRDSMGYSMEKVQVNKTVVQDFVEDVVASKGEFSNTWTILLGVLVICACVVAFSIGRMTSNGHASIAKVQTLESVNAEYEASVENLEDQVAKLEAEKDDLSSKNKKLQKKLDAATEKKETEKKETETSSENETTESDAQQQEETPEEGQEPERVDPGISEYPDQDTYWVVPQIINLRSSKEMVAWNILYVVNPGTTVYILEAKDEQGWIKIYYEGYTGYINFEM